MKSIMLGREILELPSEVVDQIAAGEVVERPAHMIKELVENAIDAGAKNLEIEVDQGGRFVRILDDGHGISKEQLPLALARHATSKIRESSDLWRLDSFGFRGEALASIAAVSELSMTSRTEGAEQAFSIKGEFGKVGEVHASGGRKGTEIRIEKLFENVPARLKFLKTESGEISQAKMMLKAMALSHPEVSFRIKLKGRMTDFWPATTPIERAQQILDKKKLYEAYGESESMSCRLFFAPPHETFGNSRNIWLFAQKRWVQDRSLQAAVMEAYRSLLMHGEFPFVVAWLECDTQLIDVNIHPTKSQVKFQDPRAAFRIIQRTLRDALEKAPWLEGVLKTPSTPSFQPSAPMPPQENLSFQAEGLTQTQFAQKEVVYEPTIPAQKVESAVRSYSVENHAPLPPRPQNHQPSWADLQVLAQANLTYIVAQSEDKLVFVDQHAAHERVAYERLMRAWKGGEMDVQAYLIPLSIDMEDDAVEAIMTAKEDIKRLGVEIDQGGPSTIVVRSAPVILKEKGVAEALNKLAQDMLRQGESFAIEKTVSEICATMACHSVIRAGQALSHEEMKALLIDMDEFSFSSFCPHGRPVFVEYPYSRLERDFGRIV